ncbi:MAG: hypothetical protein JW781_02255 [Deltaproteobacteria bacterium]|nr:hypothetical protein [Candidatus Anaeroferrophillacea bacterium]
MSRIRIGAQHLNLGVLQENIDRRLGGWEADGVPRRIWVHDGTVWIADPVAAAANSDLENRLGWLTAPAKLEKAAAEFTAFAAEVRAAGLDRVLLLGMGGSSLAPEVLMRVFGCRERGLSLTVLDSTHPAAVLRAAETHPPERTLYVVASKSGGTTETLSFMEYFYGLAASRLKEPGSRFVALTDPGSKLEKTARERGFFRVFSTPPEVGGRYSALTPFGMLPAALLGMDLADFAARAVAMAVACGAPRPAAENPGLVLGAALGELALAGRDKLLLVTAPRLRPFGAWVEQLVAESTGKQGRGILPVVDLPAELPASPAPDQYVVILRLAGENVDLPRVYAAAAARRELPLITIELPEIADLAQEFYRWEMATATVGAVLGINPFDQPDVEAAKIKARELMTQYAETGSLPAPAADFTSAFWDIHGLGATDYGATGVTALTAFIDRRQPGDYVTVAAFLPALAEITEELEQLRMVLWRKTGAAVTLGFGPRFLHSTGQLHKGDGNRGLIIQLTADADGAPLPVPGTDYDFATLISAQAGGDYGALRDAGRRVCRLHFHEEPAAGIKRLREFFDD